MSIPKTYCIYCPEMPDREETSRIHFGRIPGLDVRFWQGVHGKTFGLRTEIPFHNLGQSEKEPKSGCMSPGAVGLVLSHYSLWQHLYHGDIQEALVLEDDAVFPLDFRGRFEECYRHLPADWDFVFVGSVGTDDKPKEHVKGCVYRVRYPFGTHAYLVRHKALPFLLATQRLCWANVDVQLERRSLPWLQTFTFLPSLVAQRQGQDSSTR